QPGAQAAAGEGRADGVHRVVGVLLGADPAPDPHRQQVGQRLAGGARNDPAEHVGVHRLVGESLAVTTLGTHGGQVLVIGARPAVVGRFGQRAGGGAVGRDLGVGVAVVLAVGDAGGHLHDLLHGGVAEGAGGQFGYQTGD